MKFYTTTEIIEGAEINMICKHKGDWFAMTRTSEKPDEDYLRDNLGEITEEYLTKRIPMLKGQFDQPDKTKISVDYTTGEININKHHKHLLVPTHFATAMRQADVKIQWVHYLKTNIQSYLKVASILGALLLLAILVHWLFYIPFAIGLTFGIIVISKNRDLYLSGHLGPAIVIDAENNKIAAYTDLSCGYGSYPVIKIAQIKIPSQYLVNGCKIPIAGGYQNTHKYPHWNYFEPMPIASATKDQKVVDKSLSRINNNEWIKLQNAIKEFDGIPLTGYYPIDIEESDWKGMDLLEIYWNGIGKEKGNITPDKRKNNKEWAESKAKYKAYKEDPDTPTLKSIWSDFKSDIKKGMEEERNKDDKK